MKYLYLLLLFIPAIGLTDPRINAQNSTCHYPLSDIYANEELNTSSCGGIVIESGGIAAGYAQQAGHLHVAVLPLGLQPVDTTPVIINVKWTDLPNKVCKLKDANGNKYNASRWWSRVVLKRQKRTLPNGTEVLTNKVKWSATLRCIDGAPPAPPAP